MRPKAPSIPAARSDLSPLILRFVAVFLLSMAALTALWTFIAPGYSAVVTSLARPLLRLLETPNASVLETRGAEIWIYRIVGPREIAPFTWFDRYTFFALIPLLALLAATPGLGWLRRFKRMGAGIAALLIVHIAYLTTSIQLAYAALGLRPVGPVVSRTLDLWQVGVRVLWEAAPVAIWILLTLGAWRLALRTLRINRRPECLSTKSIAAGGEAR